MPQSQPPPLPAALLPAIIAAVEHVASILRAEFHRPGGPRRDGDKAPIDAELEWLLRERLLAAHDCAWLGEETAARGSMEGDAWVVDPLDGTAAFLEGRRGSAISVALLRNYQPVLGVVLAPLAPDDGGDLIAWAEGLPVTRNGAGVGPAEPQGFVTLGLNTHSADRALRNHDAWPGMRIRSLPSPAYRLALAAAGELDAAASFTSGLKSWDIAGGHALLIGSGRVLVDGRGNPIDYRQQSFDGCVGGAAGAVRQVLERRPASGKAEPRRGARPRRPVADAGLLSRAQGCLLGQLAGDALGSAVEFQSPTQIARAYPNGVRRLADGGTWNLIAGQPTDDSEMALALARTLIAERGFNADAVGRAYVAWRDSRPFDIGNTTSMGIDAIAQGRPASDHSQSNGALMRVSPIGLFAAGDPARAARLASEDAALTHPHPVCRAASAAFAAAIAAGVAGADAKQMLAAAAEHAGTGDGAEAVRNRLHAAQRPRPRGLPAPDGLGADRLPERLPLAGERRVAGRRRDRNRGPRRRHRHQRRDLRRAARRAPGPRRHPAAVAQCDPQLPAGEGQGHHASAAHGLLAR